MGDLRFPQALDQFRLVTRRKVLEDGKSFILIQDAEKDRRLQGCARVDEAGQLGEGNLVGKFGDLVHRGPVDASRQRGFEAVGRRVLHRHISHDCSLASGARVIAVQPMSP